MTVDLPAWRDLARSLDGTFAPGDVTVRGLARMPAQVGLTWDEGRPRLTAVVGDAISASPSMLEVEADLEVPVAAVAPSLPRALADALARWPGPAARLHLTRGVATASCTLAEGDRVDAARAHALMAALRDLHAALDSRASPYR
ncbi:MAG: hypothetical protein R2939_01705 [Kofleriaceae bacterium]